MTRGDPAAFTHLGERVRSALSARGFDTPTAPQRLAIPPLAAGDDTLVIAPTGTGKTETAMLPVFDAIVAAGDDPSGPEGFAVLYVTPLRALNRDMRERLEWWGETLDLTVDVRHGDTTRYQRSKQAEDPPDVLVTTPETLQAMLTGERLREGLDDVAHVVVDEVHELAASKRGAQLAVGLERLRELAGPFQRIGLSATVGDPDDVGAFLTGGRGCTIREVDVGSRLDLQVVHPEVTDEDERLAGKLVTSPETASHVRRIRGIVADNESTLIFVNTRQTAEALGSRFKELDLPIGVHHGSLSKTARIDVEDRFKAGELGGLLCTSSMELGIDVGRVDHVVQYRSPRQVTRLLQRVGRAGHRADRVSRGTIVATHDDDVLEAMTIARRAREGLVEPAAIHEGSLDVVANQIPGMTMGLGDVPVDEVLEILTGAYPFRDLDEATLREVIDELRSNRVIWHDVEGPVETVETTGGTWQYVYDTLSMIPDEETYDVYDVAGGQQVGTLDERFVLDVATPGSVFVQGGEMWRVAEIDEDDREVNVSPVEDPAGEVPTWVGQEIPVPRAVAGEVGELRGVAGTQFAAGADRAAVGRELTGRYPTDGATAAAGTERVERQVEGEFPMPTDDRILVEREGRTLVLNAAFGHTVNETLGRALSALIGQQTGSSVAMDVDPYRIELEVPGAVATGDAIDHLREIDPDHVGPLIELSLKRSDALAFRLSQVARTFGALDDDGYRGSLSGERLLRAFEDTPVYEEAVREVFHEDLHVDGAAAVLRAIQDDGFAIDRVRGRTPIGTGGRSSGRELLTPENADASVVDTVRERIDDDDVVLFCVHCTEYHRRTTVGRTPDQPECAECGSTRIAALSPYDDETVPAVCAADKTDDQADLTRKANRRANLVQSHGKQAVIALSARGVGPENAARIIGKLRENEDDFYRDILAREREYARTRSFWD